MIAAFSSKLHFFFRDPCAFFETLDSLDDEVELNDELSEREDELRELGVGDRAARLWLGINTAFSASLADFLTLALGPPACDNFFFGGIVKIANRRLNLTQCTFFRFPVKKG
jgi:hypothetical protein